MKNVTLKGIWLALKGAFKGFGDDKLPKLSASLAYYTVFSLAPLLIVLIYICSFVFGREAIEGSIYQQMSGFVGRESAAQIQEIIKNAWISDQGGIAATIGVITLIIGATTVFAEIQDSINMIWGLKPKPKQAVWQLIKNRLLSFGVIVSLGFLLLVSLGVSAIIEGLSNRLKAMFPDMGVVLLYIFNMVLTLGVTTLLFAVIFKVLPDAKIRWKDVWAGAIATAILFMLGRFGISFYIGSSDIGTTYGTAGSLVILLLWVYYSAIILYFGAEFTKAWAHEYGHDIRPNHYAVVAQTVQVETGARSIQEGTKHKERMEQGLMPATHRRHHAHPRGADPVAHPTPATAPAQASPGHQPAAQKAGPPPGPPTGELVKSLLVVALSRIVGMRHGPDKRTK